MTSLVVGTLTDGHVADVLRLLEQRGASAPVVLDAPRLMREPYMLSGTLLQIGDATVELGDGPGWLRRYAPSGWGAGSPAGGLEAVSRRAFLSLVGAISRIGGRRWLTPLDALLASEDKLVQLEAAAAVGLSTPTTVVSNQLTAIRDHLGDCFLVKPLAGGYYLDENSEGRAVFASVLTTSEASELDFGAAPFLAQQFVPAVAHLRVVTVLDNVWCARLPAGPYPVDWRADDAAHRMWTSDSAEPDVPRLALKLAARLGVGYSSQDWLLSDEGPVFLDLNPAGQWAFLPTAVARSVSTAIAAFLDS